MQSKESYKTTYTNPQVGGNDIGGNPSADGIPLSSNPPADGNAPITEYNEPVPTALKAKKLSLDSLKKAIQLIVTLLGTSLVGLGIIFTSTASSFKVTVDVVFATTNSVCCSVLSDGTEESADGQFEIKCVSGHTTSYSESYYFNGMVSGQEYYFYNLKPNTAYTLKVYKDGKLVSSKSFKTKKEQV